MSNVDADESDLTITLDEVDHLRRIEQAAREAARYHVQGYDCDDAWDANHMLRLLDNLAKALNE